MKSFAGDFPEVLFGAQIECSIEQDGSGERAFGEVDFELYFRGVGGDFNDITDSVLGDGVEAVTGENR